MRSANKVLDWMVEGTAPGVVDVDLEQSTYGFY
jgi:hypothetical protein